MARDLEPNNEPRWNERPGCPVCDGPVTVDLDWWACDDETCEANDE